MREDQPAVGRGDDAGDAHLHIAADEATTLLDDGTMVVVEGARRLVGRDVEVRITSVVTTANGRLVFAQLVEEASRGTAARTRSG